jgi:hypothetical protein
MAPKKRKLLEENRVFNDAWTDLYFFIDCKGKPLCLIGMPKNYCCSKRI